MDVHETMQAVVDLIQNELNILANQRPDQFDAKNPKRGAVKKNLRTKRIKALLAKARTLQKEISRNWRGAPET